MRRLLATSSAVLAVLVFAALGLARAQSPLPPAGAAPARGAMLTIHSKVLGEDRQVLVMTPPGYHAGTARYPVLYLTDAETKLEHTVSTVDFLAGNGRIPGMIVVGVVNTQRTRDLTPTKAPYRPGRLPDSEFNMAGGANRFLDFFEKELIPHIESAYRTQPHRVFAGHSFGGLFALHALFTRPDLFHGVIAVSPSLLWDEELPLREARAFFKDRAELKRSLFVTMGDEGADTKKALDAFRGFIRAQTAKGFRVEVAEYLDEDHMSTVLLSHYYGLRFLFDGWAMPRDPATGRLLLDLAKVRAHYDRLSERLGYTVPPPEVVINAIGYQLLGERKASEAIAVLKSNVDAYPASPNVHDSLGEALEQAGRLLEARAAYQKALELGIAAKDPNAPVFRQHVERVTARITEGTPSPTAKTPS